MVEITKDESAVRSLMVVEIGANGHIKLKGQTIAVLGAWNKYEDIIENQLEDMHVNS